MRERSMNISSFNAFASALTKARTGSALAIVVAEDKFGLNETLEHLARLGFSTIGVLSSDETLLDETAMRDSSIIAAFVRDQPQMFDLLNKLMPALADRWIHYCYNAEFLFFPFCENRSISDAVAFSNDEQRRSVSGYTIDLYRPEIDLKGTPLLEPATYFDAAGYYGVSPEQPAGEAPRAEIFGGLRWRYSEHAPPGRKNIDRTCIFKSSADLRLDHEMIFNQPDYNSISCKWHQNMTMAVASFRAAKALSLNPSSRGKISTLMWELSRQFDWTSDQLLRGGFIEPGQWF